MKVDDVKKQIQKLKGIPEPHQNIFYSGKALCDSDLEFYFNYKYELDL